MIKTTPTRNQVMDWLRGLASVWVVIFHLNEPIPFQSTLWQQFCKLGWLGVPVFFVISGWCMAMISAQNPDWWRFALSRLTRIFIPYWTSIIVVGAVIGIRLIAKGVNDVTLLPHSFVEIAATVALATSPATTVETINWVYWSLTYEVTFYIMVAAGMAVRRPAAVLLLLLPLSILTGVNDVVEWDFVKPLFWTDQFPLFCFGYFTKSVIETRKFGFATAALLSGSLAWCVLRPEEAAFGTMTSLILASDKFFHRVPQHLRVFLDALGRWSYSLYLIHVPVGVYVIGFFRNTQVLANPLFHLLFDLFNLSVCIGCAALFHRWIEIPSHVLSKRLGAERPTSR
jgi:peptidoglycan/LPS O-acetylase OafA/YrhL